MPTHSLQCLRKHSPYVSLVVAFKIKNQVLIVCLTGYNKLVLIRSQLFFLFAVSILFVAPERLELSHPLRTTAS